MADRITAILKQQIDAMQRSIALMEAGKMKTRTNGKDSTDESIAERQIWIAELERGLEFLKASKS